MGAFNIKILGALLHPTRPTGLFALASLLLWVGAALPAAAEPTDDPADSQRVELDLESAERAEPTQPSPPSDAPVSTSPTAVRAALVGPGTRASAAGSTGELGTGREGLALTRAAAQRRVETMSPVGWLSAYGTVRIARPD